MKSQLIAIFAAVLVVGCGESQQSTPTPEAKPEPPTAKAPDISIHDAIDEGNIEAVKQHLAAGADVNAKSGSGMPPLNYAAFRDRKEIVELLIAEGADVNAKDGSGDTPLLLATGKGRGLLRREQIVELLIAGGADVNAKVVSGPTQGLAPLDVAIQLKRSETADLLRKHGGKTGEELKAAGN